MKLNEKALANATAVFTGIVYLICGLLVAFVPDLMKSVVRSWFHGFDLAESWSGRAFPGNFLFGLITAVSSAWLAGYLFVRLYNYFVKK